MSATHAFAQGARTAGPASLQVRDLSVVMARTGTPVVEGISFEIASGRVMGLVGESGSGKSTAGLALLGHARRGLRIARGEVRLDGQDILQLTPAGLRQARGRIMAYVPQDPGTALNPSMRIGRQLAESLTVHKGVLADGETVADRIQALLEEVALPRTAAFLNSFPHQMSGGQQQRVGIAMAFACRPRLVVLDEPTTGLDVSSQRRVLETIRELTRRHRVMSVYVSHDLPVVAELADETAVLYAGRLVEYGHGLELFTRPRHPYTSRLISAVPTPDRTTRLVGIPGHPPRPGQWPAGCKFADRCPSADEACRRQEPELETDPGGWRLRCYNPVETQPCYPAAVDGARSGEAGPAALSVRGLDAHYGDRPILHDVAFDILPGECLAVVGESGSGKTTLARCLAGLHSRWSGEARLDGEPLAPDGAGRGVSQRQRLQYIFQNPFASLNPRMTVAENVAEPLRYFDGGGFDERRDRALESLDLVALGRHFADRMPGQLSGGERQRVAVARALVCEPRLLICDEITSALDVSVQALLVEQLRELQRERGLTMMFITHNLSVVRSIAQHALVLERGRVVETGTVEDILERPTQTYTQRLIADLPRLGLGE